MADYTKNTWVDDDGSGTVGTVISATKQNNLEAGVRDAAQDSKQSGLLSARPAASAATKNWFWRDTVTGVLSYCDGTNWYDIQPAGMDQFGNLAVPSSITQSGNIVVDNSDQRLDFFPVVGTLSTNVNLAAAPGASVTLDGGYVLNGATTGGGRVLLLGQTNPAQNGIYDYTYSSFSGASSWARSSDADTGAEFVSGRKVTILNGTYGGLEVVYIGGTPTLGTTAINFRQLAVTDATATGAGVRALSVNGRGSLVDIANDNFQARSNFNPVTNRLIDTTKSGWALALGDGDDSFALYRAAPTAGAPAWVLFSKLDSAGGLTLAGQLLSGSGLAMKFGVGYALATQQEFMQVWDATNGQDWSLYRPAATRDLRFYSQTAGDMLTLMQNGRVVVPNHQTPDTGKEYRPGFSGNRVKRWIKQAISDASHRRMSLFYASRDNGNWTNGEGFLITVRTGYWDGGSYTKCFVQGGYGRPFTLTPIESAGPHPVMPQLSAETTVTGTVIEVECFIQMEQFFGTVVEIEYSDYADHARPFTGADQALFNDAGATTVLGADPGWYTSIAGGIVVTPWQALAFANGWQNYGSPQQAGQYRRVGDEVQVRGLLNKGGANWIGSENVATLPVGFRPPFNFQVAVASNGNGSFGMAQLDVGTDGTIRTSVGGPANPVTWLSLTGLRFSTI